MCNWKQRIWKWMSKKQTERVQTGFNWPWAGFSGKLLATWYWKCRFNTSLNFLTSWVNINYRKPTPASRQHLITKWERATQPYLMKLKLKTHLSSAYTAGMQLRSSTMLVSPLEGYEYTSSKCCHFISCGQVFLHLFSHSWTYSWSIQATINKKNSTATRYWTHNQSLHLLNHSSSYSIAIHWKLKCFL